MRKFVFNPLSGEFDIIAGSGAGSSQENRIIPVEIGFGPAYTELAPVSFYECSTAAEVVLEDLYNDSGENSLFVVIPQTDLSDPYALDYITSNGIAIPTTSSSVVIDGEPYSVYQSSHKIAIGMMENIAVKIRRQNK